MSSWKRVEREIAKRLNGRRVPVSGRPGQPDIAHPLFSIEVKHRRRLPQWLSQGMAQAEKGAAPGQLSLVVLHPKGERYGRSLAVLRLDALGELLGLLFNSDETARGDRE
jgi:hypothetical protein